MYTLIDKDLHEEQLTLQELVWRAPYTLLYFYPKNDTPGCTLEAQEFTELHNQFQQLGIQLIGVSKDSKASHCAFISKYTLSPSYIADPELHLHKQFGARWEKNNYGKIVQWVIRSTVIIDKNAQIIHQRKNVRATGHAKKVLARTTEHLSRA
jgi:thioredoxin-dependent peroxiredoxin